MFAPKHIAYIQIVSFVNNEVVSLSAELFACFGLHEIAKLRLLPIRKEQSADYLSYHCVAGIGMGHGGKALELESDKGTYVSNSLVRVLPREDTYLGITKPNEYVNVQSNKGKRPLTIKPLANSCF